ncbi:hypothetical protein BDN70DRAFT_947370 [Pholiota conissans]|uniref:BTB domain-containing protein n=1 Tax=Pholiota conissans TaxID=109636 RepID=A0A9P6CZ82_9AGAR|nr:hypothetical protein BDN70DRAFT_947370 [Pholiota conissans]
MAPVSTNTRRMSASFCDDDADVKFLSSDGVEFKIYLAYLNLCTSRGFARDQLNTAAAGDDKIQLQESADVLEIIFQFIEPPTRARDHKHPSVFDLSPSLFFKVAEAAEKYVVYGATRVCLDRMKQIVSDYPVDVLNHCSLHGYSELANQAAQHALSYPVEEVTVKLTAPGALLRYVCITFSSF